MPRPAVTAENFWNRVKKGDPDECWPWRGPTSRGPRNPFPYGRVDAFGFKGIYVHRLAYWLCNGGELISLRKNGDALIRHSCDNTLCCNPRHLLPGTHADNMRDMVERKRKHMPIGAQSHRAKLTTHDVQQIRLHRANGVTRKALALLYEVSVSTIKGVTSGRHYADIGGYR